MGGTTFEVVEYGTNVKEVFNSLYDNAKWEYGTDPYNGTISTTSLGREIIPNDKLKKALKKRDWKTLEEFDNELYPEKRVTRYIKELAHYEAYSTKWVDLKETVSRQKGVQTLKRFVVISASQVNNRPFYLNTYDTLSEAKRVAKEKSLQNEEKVYVFQMRSDKSKVKIGAFDLQSDGKKYKSKRISKTKVYLPTYKFTFFVFAAE